MSGGGAVQGLREPITNQDPIYLNRANDGFVFFDNGCYTYGPVNRQDDDSYLQSLMLGSFNSRVVLFGSGHNDDDTTAIFQWKTAGALSDENPPVIETELDPCALKVNFVETTTCSKASPMQPWMLQRAKWQKEETPDGPSPEKDDPTSSLHDSSIRYWSLTQSAAEFFSWLSSASPSDDDDDDKEEEGTVVQAGWLCEASGAVNVIARHYDSSDDLKQVLFAEGVLQ
ncbi:MAG: hypothetical protein SGBAC_005723 [Bacillariaceae sp.]